MVVLFLTAGMLYCVAKLTSETLSSLKFLQEKSATTESATLACQRLASELKEAVEMLRVGSDLEFRKVRPSADPVVGNRGETDPDQWKMEYPASSVSTIRYRLDDSKVTRQVIGNSEDSTLGPLEVATNVNVFDVQAYSPTQRHIYRVVLTILEQRRSVTFQTIVLCPGLDP